MIQTAKLTRQQRHIAEMADGDEFRLLLMDLYGPVFMDVQHPRSPSAHDFVSHYDYSHTDRYSEFLEVRA